MRDPGIAIGKVKNQLATADAANMLARRLKAVLTQQLTGGQHVAAGY